MLGFMPSEVTVGTEEEESLMNDGVTVSYLKGRGGSNLCGGTIRTTVPPLRVNNL